MKLPKFLRVKTPHSPLSPISTISTPLHPVTHICPLPELLPYQKKLPSLAHFAPRPSREPARSPARLFDSIQPNLHGDGHPHRRCRWQQLQQERLLHSAQIRTAELRMEHRTIHTSMQTVLLFYHSRLSLQYFQRLLCGSFLLHTHCHGPGCGEKYNPCHRHIVVLHRLGIISLSSDQRRADGRFGCKSGML